MKKSKLLVISILWVGMLYAPLPSFPGGGPDPIQYDSDYDGLCDQCEGQIFNTNESAYDTDEDGIPDGDEDHDGDGLSNLEEQNNIVALWDALNQRDTERVVELINYHPYIWIMSRYGPDSVLTYAARHRYTEILELILEKNTAKQEDLDSALTESADYCSLIRSSLLVMELYTASIQSSMNAGYTEIVKRLLHAGANVNARNVYGYTALTPAASCGNIEMVKILLEAGVELEDSSALIRAASGGHTDIVQILLQAGADVNMKDMLYGGTALLTAAQYGHIEIVQILLTYGADVHAKDHGGNSALMYAREEGHTEIIDLLIEAGAEE